MFSQAFCPHSERAVTCNRAEADSKVPLAPARFSRICGTPILTSARYSPTIGSRRNASGGTHMQEWHKPEVTEQDVGLEVTSYLPAEL